MKQHAITLAHGTYTELKDTEGAKGTEDKLLWLDIQGTSEELTHFLKERQIPPFLRRRVLSSQRFPSVFSGNDYVLLSVPARKTWVQKRSVSITFILFAQEVITLCRDEGYNFDGERKQLAEGDTASIRSASDLLIALLDSLVLPAQRGRVRRPVPQYQPPRRGRAGGGRAGTAEGTAGTAWPPLFAGVQFRLFQGDAGVRDDGDRGALKSRRKHV